MKVEKVINVALLTPMNILVIGAILLFLSACAFTIFASANSGASN